MKLMNEPILDKNNSLYICIDLQGKLLAAIDNVDTLIKKSNILLKTSEIYNIPLLVTEQYPKGLGPTDERVILPKHHKLFAKTNFSVFAAQDFVEEFNNLNKKNIIVFGAETHVCVYYSVYHLLQNGYNVYVAADACGSRTNNDKQIGLEQMRKLGANIISTEMVLFGFIEGSTLPDFKNLSNLLKNQ